VLARSIFSYSRLRVDGDVQSITVVVAVTGFGAPSAVESVMGTNLKWSVRLVSSPESRAAVERRVRTIGEAGGELNSEDARS
jgi:hypothetical protein